jgi:hypothetical protein
MSMPAARSVVSYDYEAVRLRGRLLYRTINDRRVAVATPHRRPDLSGPELKLLYAESGNCCAFPPCRTILTRIDGSTGEAAHIVAAERQGPRGREPIDEVERDRRASNRVLLCPTHHTLVDSRPLVYTVEVLRKLKLDHSARVSAQSQGFEPVEVGCQAERLQSSLLPVVGLPAQVESASLRDASLSEGDVARQLTYPPESRGLVYPFIVRENRLWTFSRLRQKAHPFVKLLENDVESIDVTALASTDEGHRRVIALLNRAIGRHLGMRGVRFDREHQRYWFMPDRDRDTGDIRERSYTYETKTGRNLSRHVVHHAHRRSGEAKEEWYHEAARLRFERFGPAWFLTVRPEFHLTSDGEMPMPSHRIGRKITRKKSHLYNDAYLDRLWLWKHFLADGGPRLAIKAGEQSILVDSLFATADVSWPGVPGDSLLIKSERAAETLFTLEDLVDEESDEDWWDDDDEDDIP